MKNLLLVLVIMIFAFSFASTVYAQTYYECSVDSVAELGRDYEYVSGRFQKLLGAPCWDIRGREKVCQLPNSYKYEEGVIPSLCYSTCLKKAEKDLGIKRECAEISVRETTSREWHKINIGTEARLEKIIQNLPANLEWLKKEIKYNEIEKWSKRELLCEGNLEFKQKGKIVSVSGTDKAWIVRGFNTYRVTPNTPLRGGDIVTVPKSTEVIIKLDDTGEIVISQKTKYQVTLTQEDRAVVCLRSNIQQQVLSSLSNTWQWVKEITKRKITKYKIL